MQTLENVMTKKAPALPTDHAFVVQFRPQTDVTRPYCEGRVEHLVSGQATHFASWEHLRAFIDQVLRDLSDRSP